MTSSVVVVTKDTPSTRIARLLVEHGIGAVPVVDADGLVVGIVGEPELRARKVDATLDRVAGDIMTRSVLVVSPEEDVGRAARAIIERGVRRLVVVRAGRVVGIVSRQDLLSAFAKTDAALLDHVVGFLHACGYRPPRHEISVDVRNGTVHLSGWVAAAIDVRVVATLVAQLNGVVAVENRLSAKNGRPILEPRPVPRRRDRA